MFHRNKICIQFGFPRLDKHLFLGDSKVLNTTCVMQSGNVSFGFFSTSTDVLKTNGSDKLHPSHTIHSFGPDRSPGVEDAPLCGIHMHLSFHSNRQPGTDSGH